MLFTILLTFLLGTDVFARNPHFQAVVVEAVGAEEDQRKSSAENALDGILSKLKDDGTYSWKNIKRDAHSTFLDEFQHIQTALGWNSTNVRVDQICTRNSSLILPLMNPHPEVHIRLTANGEHWRLRTELGLNRGGLGGYLFAASQVTAALAPVAMAFSYLPSIARYIPSIHMLNFVPFGNVTLYFSLTREEPNSVGCFFGPWLDVGYDAFNMIDDLLKPLSKIYEASYAMNGQFIPDCLLGIKTASCVSYGLYVYEVLGLEDKMWRVGLTKTFGYTPFSFMVVFLPLIYDATIGYLRHAAKFFSIPIPSWCGEYLRTGYLTQLAVFLVVLLVGCTVVERCVRKCRTK